MKKNLLQMLAAILIISGMTVTTSCSESNDDNLALTLNDDLTTTLKITDCAKALQLAAASGTARRNYAEEATIDQYTQQLNKIITGQLTCKGVNQTIPM